MRSMLNRYVDEEKLAARVTQGKARDEIGGLWDEVGALQADFLLANGMKSYHRVLDLGCGCLRAGVRIVPLLDPGNYYGSDLSQSLLNAGREELVVAGLSDRVPQYNLRCTDRFDVSGYPQFDMGIAQSVFSHLPVDHLTRCLEVIRPNFAAGGKMFATFFVVPEPIESFKHSPGGTISFPDKDPFHSTSENIRKAASAAGWTTKRIETWNHPRGQQIAEFIVNQA